MLCSLYGQAVYMLRRGDVTRATRSTPTRATASRSIPAMLHTDMLCITMSTHASTMYYHAGIHVYTHCPILTTVHSIGGYIRCMGLQWQNKALCRRGSTITRQSRHRAFLADPTAIYGHPKRCLAG